MMISRILSPINPLLMGFLLSCASFVVAWFFFSLIDKYRSSSGVQLQSSRVRAFNSLKNLVYAKSLQYIVLFGGTVLLFKLSPSKSMVFFSVFLGYYGLGFIWLFLFKNYKMTLK